MLSIRTNNVAQNTVNSAIENSRSMEQAVGKLTTGKRINSGKDDAAGLIQVKRLTAEIEALRVATRNAADAQSLLDTIDTAYEGVSSILLRMRELAVQAANGSYQQADREIMTVEMKQLEEQIIDIGLNTSWGDLNFHGEPITFENGDVDIHFPQFRNTIFNGSSYYDEDDESFLLSQVATATFQIGAHRGDTLAIEISHFGLLVPPFDSGARPILGFAFGLHQNYEGDIPEAFALTNINTVSMAGFKLDAIDRALSIVSTRRGKFAATNNRLDSLIANLFSVKSNLSVSRGRIEDADVAKVTTNMARFQILQQAAVQVLSQANDIKTPLLGLLRDQNKL